MSNALSAVLDLSLDLLNDDEFAALRLVAEFVDCRERRRVAGEPLPWWAPSFTVEEYVGETGEAVDRACDALGRLVRLGFVDSADRPGAGLVAFKVHDVTVARLRRYQRDGADQRVKELLEKDDR